MGFSVGEVGGGMGGLILLAALLVSVVAIAIFHGRLQNSLRSAPTLAPAAELVPGLTEPTTLSVVIPAYNEAVNIADCIQAVLANDLSDNISLQLIVADDESTDDTMPLAQAAAGDDERVTVFTVPPRPTDATWQGKNWACANAVKKATGDYLLFIDTDVRLGKNALLTTLSNLQTHHADLLSCVPAIVCGCFSEWLVQPIMFDILAVGFDFEPVNDAQQPEVAFAAGPFMLFRRSAYDAIGGHQAVAGDLVEDVALARRIKQHGLTLRYVMGADHLSVRMYRSFWGLWEGWTKNYYSGGGRNLPGTVYSAVVMAEIFVVPWLGLAISLWQLSVHPVWGWALLSVLSAVAVGMQVYMRFAAARLADQTLRYWWLGWLGGGIVSAIAIASIIKTETGWGWTWRGRSLATPQT
ncbi:MAG: glycosyltransferase family 2 protein [Cyanobacteria bacterium J06648_16]